MWTPETLAHTAAIAALLILLVLSFGWLQARARGRAPAELDGAWPVRDGAAPVLDALRGVMALLVLIEHARGRLFVDYPELEDPSLFTQGLYFCTGLASQAVVVFFVLSGFLITRLYWTALRAGAVRMRAFATNRAVRLYLVLVPALALSWLLASAWARPGFLLEGWPLALLGNLLFLQPVLVDPLAGNIPLWSLGFEGHAYVAFGCLVVLSQSEIAARFGFAGHSEAEPSRPRWQILAAGALLLLVLAVLGPRFWHHLSLWLAGAIVAAVPWRPRRVSSERASLLMAASLAVLVAAFAVTRFGLPAWPRDWLVAVAAAGLLLFVDSAPKASLRRWSQRRWPRLLARRSYSLYVIHYPFLLLAASKVHDPAQPALASWLAYATLCIGLVLAAGLFARLTEDNTARARRWLQARLFERRS